MKTNNCIKSFGALLMFLLFAVNVFSQAPEPTITGPEDPLPPLSGGLTTGQVFTTEAGMNNYVWVVSSAGTITAPADPTVSNSITVTWTNPTSQQSVSVRYTDPNQVVSRTTVLIINYYPFAPAIDPATIPKFVDPMPHFAAGLRVNAKAGGNMTIRAVPVKQVALSTGTVLTTGTIGPATPNVGKGNYAAYEITYKGVVGPAMWPAQTVEAKQGFPLTVQYINDLVGLRYADFNILADQTLMMNGYTLNGDPLKDPYTGPIPMVVHLHGGEMPSGSDGGPSAWFMPTGTTGVNTKGPGFEFNASTLSTYPNQQEATTLWYHPHDDGLTRINVYTGLAGYYFLRGQDEETAQLPGWSGDSKVQEVTPAGKTPTFNGTNTYLPEIEIGIQDRMFNVKGELFWPVEPTNPDIHPYWTPEFVGDIITVNGKTWPYLSVAPRKYRFRILEGCNARFLNMWLTDAATGFSGPAITVIGGEGGLLQNPVTLDPAAGKTLLMAPGQRYDVIIDFTGLKGKTFTLMNDANAPYPDGDPVSPHTKQIMQFVVNGNIVSADKSKLPTNLRPVTPLVKLTDFAGNLTAGVTTAVKRQLVLNEVSADGGPASVLVNNAYFEGKLAIPGTPLVFGGPTEIPVEGTTEIVKIINISADAHPIHIHLLQWQLVSRQKIDDEGYTNAYKAAWAPRGLPEFPEGLGYPGGAGSPYPYNTVNTEGAVGGNPEITPYLLPPLLPANPEERGWKDNVIVLPGEVTTFITRIAPTDRPINAAPAKLMFPFDPSSGPGYVWHCHIVDHEDMSMMRPLPIAPSPLRAPQITVQPLSVNTCVGGTAVFSVTAKSSQPITYQWQMSADAGKTWTNLNNTPPCSGVKTATLKVQPIIAAYNNYQLRVKLTNIYGVTISNGATLKVNQSLTPTITADSGATICRLASATYFTEPNMFNYVWTISGRAGVDYTKISGGTSTSNKLELRWLTLGSKTVGVNYTNANGCTGAAPATITVNVGTFVPAMPGNFTTSTSNVCRGSSNIVYTVPLVAGLTYDWNYIGLGATITGSGNSVVVSYSNLASSGILSVKASNGCGTSLPRLLAITVTNPPAMPAYFTQGKAYVSPGESNIRYTVPNVAGLKYNWSYSGAGATITGTTNSVLISFSNTATSGTLSVRASNSCGTSEARTGYITVNNLKAALLGRDTELQIIEAPSAKNEIKAYPNPTSGLINFDFKIGENAKATLDITSVNGQLIGRIFNADVEAGVTHTVVFDKSLAAGTYLYILRWNDQIITGKFIKTR